MAGESYLLHFHNIFKKLQYVKHEGSLPL